MSPVVQPAVIMTNHNCTQMKALRLIYPNSQMLLCKWHVLHVMWSYFNTSEFLELWAKVKALVNALQLADFVKLWVKILNDPSVPQSFVQ